MIAVPNDLPVDGDQSVAGGALAHSFHYGLIAIAVMGLAMVGYAHLRGIREPKKAPANRPEQDDSASAVAERFLVPAALVSSAAAAGVHAAMAPAHFHETALFGMFFVFGAVLQMAWACLLMVRRGVWLLVSGALGNIGVLVLWAVTRTIGLPFGLLPEPEGVGAWDLVCGLWELVTVSCCVLLLRSTISQRPAASWRDWHSSARIYTGGSVLVLMATAAGGAA